jgi:hypothetical protein
MDVRTACLTVEQHGHRQIFFHGIRQTLGKQYKKGYDPQQYQHQRGTDTGREPLHTQRTFCFFLSHDFYLTVLA